MNANTEQTDRDLALVSSARTGRDSRAFADLMAAYREPLYLLLLRMTRNPHDADDLTIETFTKAFGQLDRFTPSSTFRSWLFTIGINTGIDFIRRQRLETVPLSSMARATDGGRVYEYPVPSSQPNPEEAVIRHQRAVEVRAIVSQLKPAYRQVIEMRYFEDLSYDEIAEQLHLPLGTVKVRLMRARNLISSIMEKRGGDL